jgi:hypothetical protein
MRLTSVLVLSHDQAASPNPSGVEGITTEQMQ